MLGRTLTIHSYKALFPYTGLTGVIVIDMQCVSCKTELKFCILLIKKINDSKVIE